MQRDLCVYGDFFIWLKSLRRLILRYFFVWEITSKGSQWKEGNLMGTCQCNSLEDMVKTTRSSDQWGCKISFGICSHLLKSSGIGSVLRATHMVVGFIRRTFVLREEWTEEPQGRSVTPLVGLRNFTWRRITAFEGGGGRCGGRVIWIRAYYCVSFILDSVSVAWIKGVRASF